MSEQNNLSIILICASDRISPDDLTKMKNACIDLQGGGNPVGLPRHRLDEVSSAFDLFRLLHDYHRKDFPRNVSTLLKLITHKNTANGLIKNVEEWMEPKASTEPVVISGSEEDTNMGETEATPSEATPSSHLMAYSSPDKLGLSDEAGRNVY